MSSAFLFFSCTNTVVREKDTPVSGRINIAVDESYQPFISQEVEVFNSIYTDATISANYVDENTAVASLLNDSVRLIVANRMLTGDESKVLEQHGIVPRATKIAVDAVALIVHNENPDSSMTMESLQKIIRGEIRTWKSVSGKSLSDSIVIVFDNSSSSNARYMKEKFLGSNSFPANVFAGKTNKEVIDYVAEHKRALGVVGVNWISDYSDSTVNDFLSKVRVVSLPPADSTMTDTEFYKPYQAYIALKKYPLLRDVYIISREMKAGLGTGFASFVAGDSGQRIVRRAGLLPATMPVRLIQVN
ncbi:MAG TPA: substrate-binding domain-containing protein [Bacteroidia bacterium]|nr:substrate-binding domain-containing protein [Bacteroidia bacterium]